MPQYQFLFSAVFVFQKSCTGNILGFGRNKSQTSYFFLHEDEVQSRDRGGHRGSHTMPWRGPTSGRAGLWCGPLGHPSTSPFRLYIAFDAKTLKESVSIHEKFCSTATIKDEFWGTEIYVPAPCRDGELPPEAISIDSTAIFIAVADSHDEEGVVLPRAEGSTGSYVVYLSLPWCDLYVIMSFVI
jgi:hypothetical protein